MDYSRLSGHSLKAQAIQECCNVASSLAQYEYDRSIYDEALLAKRRLDKIFMELLDSGMTPADERTVEPWSTEFGTYVKTLYTEQELKDHI